MNSYPIFSCTLGNLPWARYLGYLERSAQLISISATIVVHAQSPLSAPVQQLVYGLLIFMGQNMPASSVPLFFFIIISRLNILKNQISLYPILFRFLRQWRFFNLFCKIALLRRDFSLKFTYIGRQRIFFNVEPGREIKAVLEGFFRALIPKVHPVLFYQLLLFFLFFFWTAACANIYLSTSYYSKIPFQIDRRKNPIFRVGRYGEILYVHRRV